jgi:hypothetical protein
MPGWGEEPWGAFPWGSSGAQVRPGLMPNVEALVLAYLRGDSVVQASPAQGRASAEIPANAGTDAYPYPLIIGFRVGGAQKVRYRLDGAAIQIDAWAELTEKGGSRVQAHDVMAAVRDAMSRLEGPVTAGELTGMFTGADERASGVIYLPDPVTSRPRYTLDFDVYVHP